MSMHQLARILPLLLVGIASGCTGDLSRSGGAGRLQLAPGSEADSPLFVHFPDLDHRIVRIDLETGRAIRTYYPDLWDPRMDFVVDYAVDRTSLYVLLGRRRHASGASARLLVVDQKSGKVTSRLPLPPAPQSLSWTCDRQLLVAHAVGPEGLTGRLSLVDATKIRLIRSIPLDGTCLSVAPSGERAIVLERVMRELPDEDVLVLSSLVEVDLGRGTVLRRRNLPPGGRQVVVGPSGLIYISHASGQGNMATDGTISVLEPRTLHVTARLKLEMVVRSMRATRRHLVLNMLSSTGDPWLEVQTEDNRTEHDFKVGELVSSELTIVGSRIVVPYRRGSVLFRADLERGRWLPKLKIQSGGSGGPAIDDRPGLVRTWMSCGDDAR
jgi:hypothetical protein